MANCKTSAVNISSAERDPVFLSQKGKPGGVATLDAAGQVPISQIPIKAMFTERDPVYTADRGQPFGCATLDGLARVPRNQLGSGTADITTFLRGDGTWALGGGGGGWKQVGADIVLVTASNRVTVGDVPTFAKFGVRGDVGSDITAAIRAAAGQSANIIEIQNSGGAALVAVTPGGNLIVVGNISAVNATLSGSMSAVNVTLSGNLSAVNAILSGNLSAVDGVFTGDISAVNAILSADLSAVNAILSGNLSAVDGAFTGNVGIGIAPGAFKLDVAGDTRITGKLTVTGAIDPTSVLLSGGTALYYESNDGSTAPLSGAATGRLRYNNTNGIWQKSTQGGAYIDLMSGSGTAFRMVKWISEAETTDGPVESDAGNTFLAPNVDDFLPLGTSTARFLSVSASDVIGIFLNQGDAEYASELRFDRMAFGIGGNTNPPDVSLRRNGVNTFAISNDAGGGDITLGVVDDALYIDARNGSNAAVSGANTGRLRYNNTYGYWEQSTLGNPYVPVGDVRDIFRYSMLNNLA